MMENQVSNTMKKCGIVSLVFGILTIVAGIGFGVVSVLNGAKLLVHKSDMMFQRMEEALSVMLL